jgi:predicted enzyme related to lactoylglutathione lyase
MNSLKKKLTALVCYVSCFNIASGQAELKTYGVKINVTDMEKAIGFYQGVLGFRIQKKFPDNNTVILRPQSGTDILMLHKVTYLLPVNDNETRASVTLQVNNLDSTIAFLKQKGVDFTKYQKRKEGVGYAIYFEDPFGTRLSMMHETVINNPIFAEPRIYNYGFFVSDMDKAKQFYTSQLGFVVRSEKYLPWDLPMNHTDKSFAFMIHTRNGAEPIHYNGADNEHIVILFRSDDLAKTFEQLKLKNVQMVSQKIQSGATGNTLSFYDPFGYISEVIEVKH